MLLEVLLSAMRLPYCSCTAITMVQIGAGLTLQEQRSLGAQSMAIAGVLM